MKRDAKLFVPGRVSPFVNGAFQTWLRAAFVAGGVALSAMTCVGQLAAPAAEYRQFTNKEGRSIEAMILSVAQDRRTLKIRLRDGKEIEMEALLLSLDDQQYLKEWLAGQPGGGSNYRLNVSLEKMTGKATERERADIYRFTTEYPAYRIKVHNLSREAARGMVVEYLLLAKNNTRIFRDDSNGWTYGIPDFDDTSAKASGKEKLPDLEYNREATITTGHITLETVLGDGNTPVDADKLTGLIVRVLDGDGNVAGVWKSQDPGIAGLDWESAGGRRSSADDGVSSMRRRSIEVVKGEKFEGDRLDIAGRPFSVEARILPDKEAPNGIVASHGAHLSGWALMVKDGNLIFIVRNDAETVTQISTPLPVGASEPFAIEAELTARTMSLEIVGQPVVQIPSPGLIGKNPVEALSVGYEEERPLTFDYEAPFKFAGTIEDFAIWLPRVPAGL